MVREVLLQQREERHRCSRALHAEAVPSGSLLPRPHEHQTRPELGNHHLQGVLAGGAQLVVTLLLPHVPESAVQEGKRHQGQAVPGRVLHLGRVQRGQVSAGHGVERLLKLELGLSDLKDAREDHLSQERGVHRVRLLPQMPGRVLQDLKNKPLQVHLQALRRVPL